MPDLVETTKLLGGGRGLEPRPPPSALPPVVTPLTSQVVNKQSCWNTKSSVAQLQVTQLLQKLCFHLPLWCLNDE